MNTTNIGKEAEKRVAKLLISQKHKILQMNWRTKWCEIDVITRDKNCVYFTEVKFRSSDTWGQGIDYITTKKLKQMKFAAEFWIEENNWQGDAILQAASVNNDYEIDIIEIE
jgi:ribonuclease HII